MGGANANALDALRDPAGWPYGTAVLSGPPRSGKSLLALWFAHGGDGGGAGDVIDDADTLPEMDLFHRWNRAQEAARPLLLVSGRQPWQIALPDLRSRIGAALHLTVGEPDDEMLADLIENHAAQRGLALGEGALAYLVPRAERSFAGIESLVATIDRLTLERKVPATLSVWRDALEAVHGPEQSTLF
ncbi:MAG: DnaA/Hda family protein [Parerythrobacter sp.]